MAIWDTSVVSRLNPGHELLQRAEDAALAGVPIRVASPTVHEIEFGSNRRRDARSRATAGWFSQAFRGGLFELVPVSGHAASVSGAIRAEMPAPPGAKRKGDTRSKPERRVAWVHDIQIASIAWLSGESVCTRDVEDFTVISDLLARRFPGEAPLQIHLPPA